MPAPLLSPLHDPFVKHTCLVCSQRSIAGSNFWLLSREAWTAILFLVKRILWESYQNFYYLEFSSSYLLELHSLLSGIYSLYICFSCFTSSFFIFLSPSKQSPLGVTGIHAVPILCYWRANTLKYGLYRALFTQNYILFCLEVVALLWKGCEELPAFLCDLHRRWKEL